MEDSDAASEINTALALSPLSETIWKKAKTEKQQQQVGDVNGDTQTVLDRLNGYAEPGSITALMGPSGSGEIDDALDYSAGFGGIHTLESVGRSGKLKSLGSGIQSQEELCSRMNQLKLWEFSRLRGPVNEMRNEEKGRPPKLALSSASPRISSIAF
ncbi:hypothetical protein M569_13112 [Genlisea aurea]|uniref:Uncharacterized protein n=1 Tax=Genlisea aurea TaxID=192259 RepID=S8DPH1_9LAMI|nr:hypothetical protein M569_13112 [Genlisea aurea]